MKLLHTAILIFLSFSVSTFAQDKPEIEPVTAGSAEVELGELKYKLQPLTMDELQAEADAWQGLLKASNTAVAEAQIAKSGEDVLSPLRKSRDSVIERMQAVIDELQLKGGEVEGYNSYVSASGSRLEAAADDPMAFISQAKSWLTSEDGGLKLAFGILKFLAILIVAMIVARIIANIVSKLLDKSGANISSLLKTLLSIQFEESCSCWAWSWHCLHWV